MMCEKRGNSIVCARFFFLFYLLGVDLYKRMLDFKILKNFVYFLNERKSQSLAILEEDRLNHKQAQKLELQ